MHTARDEGFVMGICNSAKAIAHGLFSMKPACSNDLGDVTTSIPDLVNKSNSSMLKLLPIQLPQSMDQQDQS